MGVVVAVAVYSFRFYRPFVSRIVRPLCDEPENTSGASRVINHPRGIRRRVKDGEITYRRVALTSAAVEVGLRIRSHDRLVLGVTTGFILHSTLLACAYFVCILWALDFLVTQMQLDCGTLFCVLLRVSPILLYWCF